MNRRNFLITLILGGLGVSFLDAYWFERYVIDWNEFDISKGSEDKIKTIHLSDLHIRTSKAYHESLADQINKVRPDVIFFTGDSVDRTKYLPVLDAFLSMIDSDIPKFAVMGNVDYEGNVDIDQLRTLYEKHNGKLLINQNHRFKVRDRILNVIGVDDYLLGHPDFSKASKNVDFETDTVVLNHCPVYRNTIDALNSESGRKVKLVLSGHTHGGQITFFGTPFFRPEGSGEYKRGWYKNEHSNLYVSKGIGTRVLPLRFWARAEAIVFHI